MNIKRAACINVVEENGLIKCKGEVDGKKMCKKLLGVIVPGPDRRKMCTLFNVRRRKCVRKRTHSQGSIFVFRELTKAEAAMQPMVSSFDKESDPEDAEYAHPQKFNEDFINPFLSSPSAPVPKVEVLIPKIEISAGVPSTTGSTAPNNGIG